MEIRNSKPASRRAVLIANRHPRLRINRPALTLLVNLLDARFRILPNDVAHLARARTKSVTRDPQSAIPSAVPPGELSLVFLTDPALAQLHADFLADPTTTDVITFEGDPALGTAGEICVSVDTAAAYARKHRRDFGAELALYVVHGWLHLAGYDDLMPVRKRAMRRAEARAQRLWMEQFGCEPIFRLLSPPRDELDPAPVARMRSCLRDRPSRPRRR